MLFPEPSATLIVTAFAAPATPADATVTAPAPVMVPGVTVASPGFDELTTLSELPPVTAMDAVKVVPPVGGVPVPGMLSGKHPSAAGKAFNGIAAGAVPTFVDTLIETV